MSDELVKTNKPAFRVGGLTGLAAKKAAAEKEALEKAGLPQDVKLLDPNSMPERIGIVFDDSRSMGGQEILDAHQAVIEFLRNCSYGSTAVAVYPMNEKPLPLTTNLPAIATAIVKIMESGSTPLVETLLSMKRAENLTRAIVISDGSPDSRRYEHVGREYPVDTVFIGDASDTMAIAFMKQLAEHTKGIFLHFDPRNGKVSFRDAFKYLAPGFRGQLMAPGAADRLSKTGSF